MSLQSHSRLWHSLGCGCHREDPAHAWHGWTRRIFPLMSALALAWFLCRVIPRPMCAYPCPRAASPLASALVIWLPGFAGGWVEWTAWKERAQDVIRRGVQRGAAVTPLTDTGNRLKENMAPCDFRSSDAEMKTVLALTRQRRFDDPGDRCGKSFNTCFAIYE